MRDGYALASYLSRVVGQPVMALYDYDAVAHHAFVVSGGKMYDARGATPLFAPEATTYRGKSLGGPSRKLYSPPPKKYTKFTDAQLAAYVASVPALRSLVSHGWD